MEENKKSEIWALEVLAHQYGWKNPLVRNTDEMDRIINLFDEEVPTALVLETEDEGTKYLRNTAPQHVTVFDSVSDFRFYSRRKHPFSLLIAVSPKDIADQGIPTLHFIPTSLHLGVGCQKGASVTMAKQLLAEIHKKGFSTDSIVAISTIDAKRDEPLLQELKRLCPRAELRFHAPAELAKVNIPNPSQKVFESSGCYGIAESSALIEAPSGKMLIENQKRKAEVNGKIQHFTFALAQ